MGRIAGRGFNSRHLHQSFKDLLLINATTLM
jgi:hypothetical protein